MPGIVLETVPAAIFVVQNGRILYGNPKMAELSGFSVAELMQLDPYLLSVPGHRDEVRSRVKRRAEGTAPAGETYEIRCAQKDGSEIDVRVSGARIELNGQPADVVTMHDVTELKQATRAAQERAELLAQTEELASMGSSRYDVATGEVTQSAGMFRIFGEPPSTNRVDGEWLMRRVPASEEAVVRAILTNVMPGEPCEFEHRIVRADGTVRTVLHRVMAYADSRGKTARVVGILQDVTRQRSAEQQLALLANSDEVTGLPNRAALLDCLDQSIHRSRQGRLDHGRLLVMQIDQLELVSESMGYSGADQVLAAVAARLRRIDLEHETLAHLGSGEYALLHCVGDPEARLPAASLASAIAEVLAAPFTIDGTEVQVSCAIGISEFGDGEATAGDLLHQAQAAMHRAREQSSQRYCVFSADLHARGASRLATQAALRRALERREFSLLYQPQVDLASGRLIGVEALLRWNDPTRGVVSPLDFIPVAEESGLIVPIGEWILRTACEQNLAWQREGLAPIRVAVNLSVRQLQQPDIARRINAILLECGLNPRHLGLEITESLLIEESTHVAHVLGELKTLGIEISLDDFGTGYSNLNYVRQLPIDVVKVDRSFVHDVTAAPHDVSMTRAVIKMAHSLQMKVLAEGVETEGQLALLIANGCDQMQGYYFSRPVAAEAIAGMLREGACLPAHFLSRRAKRRTLLLVDDEDNVVASLRRLLRREGYHLIVANSGAQGLQRLAEEAVDVIVSDQRMPGMTGVEFLRRAKELYPDTVRIVLSGYTELQSITDAVNEGAIYKFLTKPWDDERLLAHIAEAFRQKEMGDENRRLSDAVQSANGELAEVNARLQQLLESQRGRLALDAGSLNAARDMLDNIPAAVIGIDLQGMIAYANADAEGLLAGRLGLLGRDAREALPAALMASCLGGDGSLHGVDLAGHLYSAVCRTTPVDSGSHGRLIVLTPAARQSGLQLERAA